MSTFSNLPLQEMIRTVVSNATEKLASEQNTVKAAMVSCAGETCEGCSKCEKKPEATKEASFTEPDYVEKLASACDFIASNIENIETPNRGVLGAAIAKMAGEEMPPAVTTPEQLSVQAAMPGKQQYKHDKPKGEDAAASQAEKPLSAAGMPGGKTQLDNNMHDAPGPQSGAVPTAEYPKDGPLHAGPSKTASGLAAMAAAIAEEKTAGAKTDAAKRMGSRYLELLRGGKKMPFSGAGPKGRALGNVDVVGARPGLSPTAWLQRTGAGTEARKALATQALTGTALGGGAYAATRGGKKEKKAEESVARQDFLRRKKRISQALPGVGKGIGMVGQDAMNAMGKSAADIARETILRKLAGEDVMKASVSSGKSGGPLVGDGVMDAYQAEQVPSNATDGSGYGNQQRPHVKSNDAAMNYTKADAKKPRVKELKEVLETPAFDPAQDSKLREQLRNAGSAGVKIAGANNKELLKQAAAQGLLSQETVNQFREMRKQAQAEEEVTNSNPKVEALKQALKAKKEKESQIELNDGRAAQMGML